MRSKFIDTQECINLYPEMEIPSSKNVTALIGTPGLSLYVTLAGLGGVRGLYQSSDGRFFGVCGNNFYEIKKHAATLIGTISSLSGLVSMADNGNQLILVDGVKGYLFDLIDWNTGNGPQGGNYMGPNHWAGTATPTYPIYGGGYSWDGWHHAGTFTIISPVSVANGDNISDDYAGFPCGSKVIFKDGYFVCNAPGTMKFFISEPYEGALWNALQYASAEGSPDPIVSVCRTNNELYLFGSQSTEVWFNSGAAPFPFQRIQGAFFDIGTVAANSTVTNGNDVFWLGATGEGQGVVMHANGYVPTRISTHSIEYMIAQLGRIDDAVGWTYQQEGHVFYVLTFPTGNRTFVFDLITGLWHERGCYNSVTGVNDKHRGICCSPYNQLVYVGDWQNGNVYRLALDVYTDAGNPIRRVRTSPHIHFQMERLFYHELEFDMVRGQGLVSGQGNDPQVMLQWSNDGGFTWSTERWEPIGKMGEYKTRIHFHGLGSARDRVFKVVISDPIPVIFMNADIDFDVEDG